MPKLLALLKMKKGEVKTISCRDNGKKRKIKDGVIKNIIKPSCVIDYNKGMGVDKQDQLLSCFPLMRRCVKRYKKIFFYLLDIAVYNAYVLYSKITNTTKTSINYWRKSHCQIIKAVEIKKVAIHHFVCRQRKTTSKINRRIHHLSKKDRITYNLLLQQYNTGAFFDRLITGAEKWVHIFQTIIVGITETGLNKSAHGSEKDTSGWALNSPFATLYEKIIYLN
ncbi:piggyBac transposable element-derived protein 4-like [Vespula maculifrons]|uniref:PiggyBac transposable element-derived protein 4-like n=1 Tax=Vespula maculifrons TaxID=7453 RepID=A0ABD2ASI5_VESMC